jgi:hypothetical protein
MSRLRTLRLVLAGLCLASSPLALGNPAQDAANQLQRAHPGLQLYLAGTQLQRIYGAPFGHGLSPEESAQNFVRTYSEAFGVSADELLPGNAFNHQYTQPLVDAADGTRVATLVYYQQYHAGIPVYRSELRLLALNQPGYPLIWAGASLHDLSDWRADEHVWSFALLNESAAYAAAAAAVPGLIAFDASELVIWAGVNDQPAPPRLALAFDADNGSAPGALPLKWHFVADACTGDILYQEDRVVHTDVVGNVQGVATSGIPPKADICNPETASAMRYAKVAIGGTTAYADADGNFTIPNGGSSPVVVTSYMGGQYFVVNDQQGPVETLSLVVTPPGPANFLHNAANTSEFIRAEVNAYVQANIARDFALVQNPDYPVIATQTNFPLYVNGDTYCSALYYNGAIYLNRAGTGCANSAFSSIVHHEYGHHLVQCGGSGQGMYGEGMGDSIGVLISDDPVFGYGLEGDCNSGGRSADNTLQYPCDGTDDYCGILLSGCVWETRNALLQTNPTTYLQILAKLTVNSILLHGPTDTITPAIYTDFITLDGLYYDGAHEAEITAGFAAHNMVPPPAPPNDNCADAIVACPGQAYPGSTVGAAADGATTCGNSNSTPDVWYTYMPATSGTAVFSLCSGTDYDSVMSVHSGCPGTSGNTLACNDDACSQPYSAPSEITRSVTAGTLYVIRVSGWDGSAGSYTFTIDGPACAADCNGNGIPDNVDIANGTSNDDDGNGVPDECEQLIGDLNCDGSVDFGDINPFVLLLSNEAGYRTAFPNCIRINGDINNDGTYGQGSFGDINPFVALLSRR